MREVEQQLRGYRLTTAEILYHMPDHPDLLQTLTWQTFDMSFRYSLGLGNLLCRAPAAKGGTLYQLRLRHARKAGHYSRPRSANETQSVSPTIRWSRTRISTRPSACLSRPVIHWSAWLGSATPDG